jgi:nucleotide-binding universal stress UspA family protein
MKILVPTDFSESAENAYRFARKIAHLHDATITLLFSFYQVYDFAAQQVDIENTERDAKKELKKAILQGTGEGLKVDSKIIQGSVATSVTATAYREDYDLIVMGTQGASGLKKALVGSNSVHVIKESEVPILVIPQSANLEAVRKISIAVDLEKDDPVYYKKLFAITAHMNLPLEVIHFDQSDDFSKQLMWQGLETFFKERLPDHQIFFRKESTKDFENSLKNYLEENQNVLLVIFYKDKTFLEYLFDASQTVKMAYHTHVPLLVIK